MEEVPCTVKYHSFMNLQDNPAFLLVIATRYILNSNPSKNVHLLCILAARDCIMEGQ